MDAITDHLFLPEKEELEKLLRYEAMINRQLNHAIAELERLQARRNGGPAPYLGLQNKANKIFVFIDCIAGFGKTNPSNWHRSIKDGRSYEAG